MTGPDAWLEAAACGAAWGELLNRCAAHQPKDHHEVHRVVMVSRADLDAAVRAALRIRQAEVIDA